MSGANGRDAILQERHIVEVKLSDFQSEFLRREYRLAKWRPRGGSRRIGHGGAEYRVHLVL